MVGFAGIVENIILKTMKQTKQIEEKKYKQCQQCGKRKATYECEQCSMMFCWVCAKKWEYECMDCAMKPPELMKVKPRAKI